MLIHDKTVCGRLIAGLKRGSAYRVELKCDRCGKVTTTTYQNYCTAQIKRGWTGKTYCKGSCHVKMAWEDGSQPRKRRSPKKPRKTGPENGSWRGGQYIDAHGYRMIYTGKGRRKDGCGWNNYRKEHVLVMEEHLGRKIEKGEVVHHINGDKLDNRIENLVLTKHAGHRDAHQSLQEIGYQLFRAGLVSFDRENLSYVADDKLRELLGRPEEGNQQPSAGSDPGEGSTTRRESLEDNNSPTSAGHADEAA